MLWWTLRKLRSSDFDARSQAFAEAKRSRNVDALLQVVEDADEYIRSSAVDALGEIADPKAVPALIKRLEDSNFNNQEHAAAALAKIGDPRAVLPLVAHVRAATHHPQARQAAAKALIDLADAKAIPGLIDALQDKDGSTPRLALEVIAVIGEGRCVPAVIPLLSDARFAYWAAITLGALRDPRATDALLHALAEDPKGSNRRTLIDALGKIGDGRAAPALLRLLSDPEAESETRNAAAVALKAMAWKPTDDTLRAQYLIALEQWDDLANLGWERVAQPLLNSLHVKSAKGRDKIVTALGAIGGPHAVDALLEALKDEDEFVQDSAARALSKVGDARAVMPLVEYCLRYSLKSHANDPHAPQGEQKDASERVSTLQVLVAASVTRIAPGDLEQLLALKDKEYRGRVEYNTPGYGDGADEYTVVLSFSNVRDLAARESLRRRSSLYRNEDDPRTEKALGPL
jgi:HEAT repeat protein